MINYGIIVCGLNGSGKSTFGKALAEALNYRFLDVEDYYFPNKQNNYKYENPRSTKEVTESLIDDIGNCNFVFASVIGNYNDELISKFTHVILIEVPKEIRLERVRNRSFQKFGCRMLEGGDLYEKESAFFEYIKNRKEDYVEKWLNTIKCPIIKIDGTKSIEDNIKIVIKILLNKL